MITKGKHFSTKAFAFLLFLLLMASTSVDASRITGVINVGCDSNEVFLLIEKLAEKFMDNYPRIQIFIEVIPPDEAIDKLKRGLLDMVFTLDYVNFRNTAPVVLAKEGIIFIINEQNTKNELSFEELSLIFSGNIRSWNDLGLNAVLSRRLEVVGPNDSTLTHKLFQKIFPFNINPYARVLVDSDEEVIAYVAENRYSFGYISLNSINSIYERIKLVSIDGVYPSLTNIFNNQYRFCNTYYLITDTTPYGVIERFVDFITDANNMSLKEFGLISYKEVFK